jgi:hypothetical protein
MPLLPFCALRQAIGMKSAKPSSAQRHDMTAAISDALRQAESQGDMETAVALLAILRATADSSAGRRS